MKDDLTYEEILLRILADPSLDERMKYGAARRGHPEGSVAAHAEELNRNLLTVLACIEQGIGGPQLSSLQLSALRILIRCHDSFKGDAAPKSGIMDPNSHASLARAYLEQYTSDQSLLNMVQRHDEPYAIYRRWQQTRDVPTERLSRLFEVEIDWDTFLLFQIIDNTTPGKKSRENPTPTAWFREQAAAAGLISRDLAAIEERVRAAWER